MRQTRSTHRCSLRRHASGTSAAGGGASGVALISVLWLLALLTLLASAATTLSVANRRSAERILQSALMDSQNDGAIRVALLRVFAAPKSVTSVPMARLQTLAVFGSTVDVAITREAGRLDLNTGAVEILTALFAANGWAVEDAQAMAERIRRFRDSMESAGAVPAFESVNDLRLLPGADRISSQLFDALTVYSQASVPASSAAAPAVLRALSWADERQLGGHRWLPDGFVTGEADGAIEPAALIGEILRVRACVAASEWVRCRVATARLTGNMNKPLQVFEWKTDATAAGSGGVAPQQ